MTVLKLDQTTPTTDLSEAKPLQSAASQHIAEAMTKEYPFIGSIVSARSEIDDALADQTGFSGLDPDRVFEVVSAHSARMIELIVHISRIEVVRREWKPVREEAERVVTELRQQFQIASRRMASRELDWNMQNR
jgi:hypothetical protein